MARPFRAGQRCRVKRGDVLRQNYFERKYGDPTPTVVIEGPLDEVYGSDWKSRFMTIPECFEFFAVSQIPVDDRLLRVHVVKGTRKKRAPEIVHETELRHVAA